MESQQQTGAPLSTVGVRKRVNKSTSGELQGCRSTGMSCYGAVGTGSTGAKKKTVEFVRPWECHYTRDAAPFKTSIMPSKTLYLEENIEGSGIPRQLFRRT
jgi:hypothetical protein